MSVIGGTVGYFHLLSDTDFSGDAKRCSKEADPNLCRRAYYLQITEEPHASRIAQLTGTWMLILTNLVPISLMVSLEMVKYF